MHERELKGLRSELEKVIPRVPMLCPRSMIPRVVHAIFLRHVPCDRAALVAQLDTLSHPS
jgi:hypothetical protein